MNEYDDLLNTPINACDEHDEYVEEYDKWEDFMNTPIDGNDTEYDECENILDTIIYLDDEYFGEMATVASDENYQLRLQVNPDPGRIGHPYFKVFDNAFPKKGESHVARFHFKNEKMEYHNDKYLEWVINNRDIKRIRSFLMEPHEDSPQYTNWQMACFLWNYEYRSIKNDKESYFQGKYDELNKDNPSYVKHDQEMPKTWIYNPSKSKNKRK